MYWTIVIYFDVYKAVWYRLCECIQSGYGHYCIQMCRNKRMLGVLMGTLNRFKVDQQKESQTGKVCVHLCTVVYTHVYTKKHTYIDTLETAR